MPRLPPLNLFKQRSPRVAVDAPEDFSGFTTLTLESVPIAPSENRTFRVSGGKTFNELLEGPKLGPARKLEEALGRAGARGTVRGREARGDAAAPGAARS